MRFERPVSRFFLITLLVCVVVGSLVWPCPVGSASNGDRTLESGWFRWRPYIYSENVLGISQLTGLDVEVTRAVFKTMQYKIDMDQRLGWVSLLDGVRSGDVDFVIGSFKTEERTQYAYFSDPYRSVTISLYFRKGEARKHTFDSVEEIISTIRDKNLRLGVIEGFSYGNDRLDRFVQNNKDRELITVYENDTQLLHALINGHIDTFLSYKLPAETVAWNQDRLGKIESHPFTVGQENIHVMFSKKTVTPNLVETFNRNLRQLKQSGEYYDIVKEYLLPILLSMTTQQFWFFAVDLFGTIAFSISGIILARKENYDLFGAYALASMPALGGGITRDLLVGRRPIAILRTPSYILAVFITVTVAFFITNFLESLTEEKTEELADRYQNLFNLLVEVGDAIGLAAFTIIGVGVAIEMNTQPLYLWGPLLAVVTGAGGGIIRDTVRSASHTPSLKGEIYPEIAVLWGLIFSVFMNWQTVRLQPNEIFLAVIVTLLGAFLSRLFVIYRGINSPFF